MLISDKPLSFYYNPVINKQKKLFYNFFWLGFLTGFTPKILTDFVLGRKFKIIRNSEMLKGPSSFETLKGPWAYAVSMCGSGKSCSAIIDW
jgi:hypothetical protein